jgi:hypothetical protein
LAACFSFGCLDVPCQDTEAATAVFTNIKAAGGEAFALHVDSIVCGNMHVLVAATVKCWGQLNIVVNNTAIGGSVLGIKDENEVQCPCGPVPWLLSLSVHPLLPLTLHRSPFIAT